MDENKSGKVLKILESGYGRVHYIVFNLHKKELDESLVTEM